MKLTDVIGVPLYVGANVTNLLIKNKEISVKTSSPIISKTNSKFHLDSSCSGKTISVT